MVRAQIVIQKHTKGKPTLGVTIHLLSAIPAAGSLVTVLAEKGEAK